MQLITGHGDNSQHLHRLLACPKRSALRMLTRVVHTLQITERQQPDSESTAQFLPCDQTRTSEKPQGLALTFENTYFLRLDAFSSSSTSFHAFSPQQSLKDFIFHTRSQLCAYG